MNKETVSNCAFERNGLKPLREMSLLIYAVIVCLWFTCCNDDYVDNVSMARNQLQVTASTTLTKSGTDLILGNYLPSGATLGVSLRPTSGGNLYDNIDYTNFLFTASGTESSQVWAPETGKPILLSNTQATAYAYFPRQAGVTDITKVPISNETETDYMYSAPAENISISNNSAAFQMSHVMSVVRIKITNGNYSGAGSIESIALKGNTAATSAKLNVMDGSLTDITGGDNLISKTGPWTLAAFVDQDLWAVPAGESSPLQFIIQVDGKSYKATSETIQLLPGKIFTYTLVLKSQDLQISSVTVTDWDIIPSIDLKPKGNLSWTKAQSGVYAVGADMSPVPLAEANASCIGVALINREKNQCLMIEKYGERNASYKEAQIAYGGYNVTIVEQMPEYADLYYSMFSWGGDNVVYENISSASTIDGTLVDQGGFDMEGENYLSSDPSTWTDGALSDFNGKENSPCMLTLLSNDKDLAAEMDCTPIGYALKYFNDSDDNQGFSDWFIPSLGQLALIMTNQEAIDQALTLIGGTPLIYERFGVGTSAYYWSSTQYNAINETVGDMASSFLVVNEEGMKGVYLYPRIYPNMLRLVRDLLGDNTRHFPEKAEDSILSNEHTINLVGDKTGLSITQRTATDGTIRLYVSPDDLNNSINSISISEGCTVEQINDFKNNRIKITLSALSADVNVTFGGVSTKVEALEINGITSGMTIKKATDSEGFLEVILKPTSSDTYINGGYFVSGAYQLISENYQVDGSLVLKMNLLSTTTLSLNGVGNFVDASTASDGVYCIWPGEKLAKYGDTFCTGVALINSVTNQKLMIEKYENENNEESTTIYENAAQLLGSNNSYDFSWGGQGRTSGTFVSSYVGAGLTKDSGYLPMADGTYDGSPNINGNPSEWIGNSGALSDFEGKSNSVIISNITDNGTSSTNCSPMAILMNAFNNSDCPASVNQGYRDWYIPSCGQLGLMWLNVVELNSALCSIGGTKLESSYWSSSESNGYTGWKVQFYNGYIKWMFKDYSARVRLVRDL